MGVASIAGVKGGGIRHQPEFLIHKPSWKLRNLLQLFCLLLTASVCYENTLSTWSSGHLRSLCSSRLSNGHNRQSPSKMARPERWTLGKWEGRLWGKLRALGISWRRDGPGRVRTSFSLVGRLPPGARQCANNLCLLQMKSSRDPSGKQNQELLYPSPKQISFRIEVAFHQWSKLNNSADGEGTDSWCL